MAVTLPYPDKPANGQVPDATPILANLQALLQAINAFDGGLINAKSVVEAALADAINPRLRDSEIFNNFVDSGGLPLTSSGLTFTVPTGIAYTNGYRHTIPGQSFSVAINNDTYFSVNQNGTIDTPQAMANGAARPPLPLNSQWLFKVVSASAITSIVDLRNLSPVSLAVMTNPYKFQAYRSGAYTSTGQNPMIFDATVFDTSSSYSTSTGKYTIPATGYYYFHAQYIVNATTGNKGTGLALNKNAGVLLRQNAKVIMYMGNYQDQAELSYLGQFVAGDTVYIVDIGNSGFTFVTGSAITTVFEGFMVSGS